MALVESKNVKLRSVESSDIDTLLLWENDSRLWQYGDVHYPFTREQIEEFVANQQMLSYESDSQFRFMIVDSDNRAIGTLDLFDNDGTTATVGILIYEESDRRCGYALEALSILEQMLQNGRMMMLRAEVSVYNDASLALFRKAGYAEVDNDGYRVLFELLLSHPQKL